MRVFRWALTIPARVGDNVDRKPDPGHPPAGLFNLDAHIHDADTGHPVPYVDVHVTVARDGESVFTDVALVPVARPHRGTAGRHYGNNVRLDEDGGYRVVVRLEPSPLTGTTDVLEMDCTLDPVV